MFVVYIILFILRCIFLMLCSVWCLRQRNQKPIRKATAQPCDWCALPRPLHPLIKHARGSTRVTCQTAWAAWWVSYESDSRARGIVSKSAASFVYGERKRKVNTFNLIARSSESLRTCCLYIRWAEQGKQNYLRHDIVDECNNYC